MPYLKSTNIKVKELNFCEKTFDEAISTESSLTPQLTASSQIVGAKLRFHHLKRSKTRMEKN